MPASKIKQSGLLDSWGRRNRKYAGKKCPECGKPFKPIRARHKYCSAKCYLSNRAKGITDITGKRFKKLLVIRRVGKGKYGRTTWMCVCDCGKEKIFTGSDLLLGKVGSCGCAQYQIKDISGRRFGRLVVLGNCPDKSVRWKCKCDCGKIITTQRSSLISGRAKSCGCLRDELRSQRSTGNKNPNYNPSLTHEGRIDKRENALNERWVKSILNRDKYICRLCSAKISRYPIVHHLDGYHWAKNKRLDINNGVALCSNCHKAFHRKYGHKNNTKEQFVAMRALAGEDGIREGRVKVKVEMMK